MMWAGQARKADNGGTCSAPPIWEHVHRLGSLERNTGNDALRIVDEGQGDGVQKLAGRTTTACSRADRAHNNFHRGRSRDRDRRGQNGELRGRNTVNIGGDGPIVVVVEVADGHDRRGSWELRDRGRRRNMQGKNGRRTLRRGAPNKPDYRGLRGVETRVHDAIGYGRVTVASTSRVASGVRDIFLIFCREVDLKGDYRGGSAAGGVVIDHVTGLS